MDWREIEGTDMYILQNIKLERILAGRWGQVMDSKKFATRMSLGLAMLVFPALSAGF